MKYMSTSQKKRTTLLPFQTRAPMSNPLPLENSSFNWMKVKFLKLADLEERKQSPTYILLPAPNASGGGNPI